MAKKATKGTARKGARRPAPRREGRADGGGGAPARPMWSGNIRLALVSVPVKIYPATRPGARISFHQVHQPSGRRVRYQKIVPGIGPVDTDEIVKGFEIDRDRYVLIDPEEVEELRIEARKTLDLVQFVAQGEIDPIWFDRPYYVAADGELAEEAYNVLREALRASGKVGLGQFVMRGREYVAALKPCGSGLLLETLRFADEVREAAPFFAEIDDFKPDKELLDLARELIARKTAAFDPGIFQDRYTEAVRELIEARRRKKKPVEISDGEEPSGGAQVIDLVDALKKSVRGASSGGAAKKRRKAG
jgi:DNA end-binding protein Ku